MKYNYIIEGRASFSCDDYRDGVTHPYVNSGIVCIEQSGCFAYGNQKVMWWQSERIDVDGKQFMGKQEEQALDIRYDTRYREDKEVAYITEVFKERFQNVSKVSLKEVAYVES